MRKKEIGVPHPISLDSKYWTNRRILDPGNAAEVLPVDIKDGVDQEIIDIFLRQGDQKLVRKEEVEEIMSIRGRHVEMPEEHVERAHCCYC